MIKGKQGPFFLRGGEEGFGLGGPWEYSGSTCSIFSPWLPWHKVFSAVFAEQDFLRGKSSGRFILVPGLSHLPLLPDQQHSRPKRPRSFWSAPRITTSGQIRRHRFLNGFVNTIDWDQNQSHLSILTLYIRRVTGSLWIADFRCWAWPEGGPEVAILGADQKERSL